MASEYLYDVFLSYSRKGYPQQWVKMHFQDMLINCLRNVMPTDPKVFIDDLSIQTGMPWPSQLQENLRRSRVLVAVWSPPYFRSPWCTAEWMSMVRRMQYLKNEGKAMSTSLVFPIRYADGESFPQEARETQSRDFSKWNSPFESFKNSPEHHKFYLEVNAMTCELVEMIKSAPPWDPNWPIDETPPVDSPPTGFPSLG